jgi:hypothetical protein
MDPAIFEGLPTLPPGKHLISELHVLLCDPPKPVAVQIKRGYHLLPPNLWVVAELVARVAQDIEVDQLPSCSIHQFLILLLGQVVGRRGILDQLCQEQGSALLTVLLKNAKQREANLAIGDGSVA